MTHQGGGPINKITSSFVCFQNASAMNVYQHNRTGYIQKCYFSRPLDPRFKKKPTKIRHPRLKITSIQFKKAKHLYSTWTDDMILQWWFLNNDLLGQYCLLCTHIVGWNEPHTPDSGTDKEYIPVLFLCFSTGSWRPWFSLSPGDFNSKLKGHSSRVLTHYSLAV